MKFKTVLYNATIILPVCSRIISTVKLIVELVTTNKQVLEAFQQMHDDVKYLKDFEDKVNRFNKTMNAEENEDGEELQ